MDEYWYNMGHRNIGYIAISNYPMYTFHKVFPFPSSCPYQISLSIIFDEVSYAKLDVISDVIVKVKLNLNTCLE